MPREHQEGPKNQISGASSPTNILGMNKNQILTPNSSTTLNNSNSSNGNATTIGVSHTTNTTVTSHIMNNSLISANGNMNTNGATHSPAMGNGTSTASAILTSAARVNIVSRRNSENHLTEMMEAHHLMHYPNHNPGHHHQQSQIQQNPPMSALRQQFSSYVESPASPSKLISTTKVHPDVEDLDQLDEYVREDPSTLLQVFPDVVKHIEDFCLAQPQSCKDIWLNMLPLLKYIEVEHKISEQQPEEPRPSSPICEPKTVKWVNMHQEEWQDDYGWLNDRENPQVLDYIKAENDYAEQQMEHTKPLQRMLYKEFVSRLDENAESAKTILPDGWSYYTKKIPGEEYVAHCRSRPDGSDEEIYLNENELANSEEFEGAPYFKVNFLKHSPKGGLLAFGVDSFGNERNNTFFMDLKTKILLPDRIEGVYEDFEFTNDGKYCYYTLLDECERAYQLKRHCLGEPVEKDEILHHEEDEMFFLTLTKSCNGQEIIMNSSAQITSETRFLPADDSSSPLMLLFPRQEGIQYTCEPHQDYFYVLTNEESKNNWLFRVKIPKEPITDFKTIYDERETVVEHRDFVLIEDFGLRRNHLIVFERSNCLQNVRIVDLRVPGFNSYHYISFSESVYALWPGSVNEEVADLTKSAQFDSEILRFTYTSFVQPKQVIDYNMDTRIMTVVNEERVGGILPFDPNLYVSKRLFTTGVDGTTVPISLVYRRDLLGMMMNPAQPNPLLLHGYGAYGTLTSPIFSSNRLSLLDRGFIYAIAHIRGGAEMGNAWYEEGKLAKKPNTFYDFIAVAEYLIKEGYTSPSKIAIYGRSAGGLLIGACLNMRPDLFRAALTEVPFVDVVNTMFDPTIPWTAFEYEEWGNPADREIYDVMKTYCPYTNIKGDLLAQNAYPHLLVVGGMNDPRVAFFEPLKFVAKMRGERRNARKRLASYSSNNASTSGAAGGVFSPGAHTNIDHYPYHQHHHNKHHHNEERMLLLKVDEAGHGGNSGQYSFLEDLAFEYAFLITALDANTKPIFPGTLPAPHGFDSLPSSPMLLKSGFGSQNTKYSNEFKNNQGGPGAADESHNNSMRKLKKKFKEEDEYRRGTKGDRGQNRLFQWVANFF